MELCCRACAAGCRSYKNHLISKNGDFDMNDIKKALLPMKTRLFFQKAKQEICAYIEEKEELASLGEEYKKKSC